MISWIASTIFGVHYPLRNFRICQTVLRRRLLPLLIAGTTYANTSDNGRPEKERVAILKNSVASSTAYKMASPGVQMAMMSVVEDIADPKELALHQKEVRRLGASYLSDSGVSWASKTVSPFTAWCNFNRLES
jgi:hypothetical protein